VQSFIIQKNVKIHGENFLTSPPADESNTPPMDSCTSTPSSSYDLNVLLCSCPRMMCFPPDGLVDVFPPPAPPARVVARDRGEAVVAPEAWRLGEDDENFSS
jgi:hypothetical protein